MKNKNHLEKILQTARDFFIKYNYDSVSMNDIASKLKISKAALYYYFASKKDLYISIIDLDFNSFKTKIKAIISKDEINDENIKNITEKLILVTYDFILNKLGLIKFIYEHNQNLTKLKEIATNLEFKKLELFEILKPLSEKILIYKNAGNIINHEDISMLIMFSVKSYTIKNYAFKKKATSDEVVKKIIYILFN